MIVAIIPADSTLPITFKDIPNKDHLKDLQEMVGGTITAADVYNEQAVPMQMYVNDEGLLIGLPYNVRATWLYTHSTLTGDAVAYGGTTKGGNMLSLNDKQIAYLKSLNTELGFDNPEFVR